MNTGTGPGTPGSSGPPGHHYVAVASRMVIPKSLDIEQVAIILMKAKKALQQLQFQWAILNRPASGIGFVMFWDGVDLPDDGYLWMNRGRTDTLPTHQKSISIEATRFFDGYAPGDRHVTMTKTFYRFAGQPTSLFFVHYMAPPLDAPRKPIGPPIPTVKPLMKPPPGSVISEGGKPMTVSPDMTVVSGPSGRKRSASPNPPIQVSPSISPLQAPPPPPAIARGTMEGEQSSGTPTTIRLSLITGGGQPPATTATGIKTIAGHRASPGRPRGRRALAARQVQRQDIPQQAQTQSQRQQQPIQMTINEVNADFDLWGPVDHAVNRLARIDAFYNRLFSTVTLSDEDGSGLNAQVRQLLREELTSQLQISEQACQTVQNDLDALGGKWSGAINPFDRLDQCRTEADFAALARDMGLCSVVNDISMPMDKDTHMA